MGEHVEFWLPYVHVRTHALSKLHPLSFDEFHSIWQPSVMWVIVSSFALEAAAGRCDKGTWLSQGVWWLPLGRLASIPFEVPYLFENWGDF